MADQEQKEFDLLGRTLGDAYRVERLIGKGGMGIVYEASHTRVQRPYAIKVLNVNYADNPQVMARFRREAMLGARLGHENIVEVMDFNSTEEGFPYLVMELLEGQDLQQLLTRQRRLPLEHAAALVRQVLLALSAAHDEGVVHRDLKPENIFICRHKDGQAKVKVLDFGISKVLDSESIITHKSAVLGTPHFMSPEQAEGRVSDIDHRTDIFAVGLILYHMLAGKLPFAGPSLPSIMYDVVHAEPPPLDTVRPDLPSTVVQVVEKAIRKDRADRHQSAMELLDDLAQAMGDRWNEVLIWSVTVERENRGNKGGPGPLENNKSYRDEAFLPTAGPEGEQAETHGPLDSTAGATVGPAVTRSGSLTSMIRPGRGWMFVALACGLAALVMGGVLLSRSNTGERTDAPPVPPGAVGKLKPAGALPPVPPAQKPAPAPPATPDTGPAAAPAAPDRGSAQASAPAAVGRTRSLSVRSIPGRAEVLIGKKKVGTTPLEGQIILQDEVDVVVRKRGHVTARHRVPAGVDSARVVVRLTPLPASLSVVALHRGNSVTAKVFIDGKYYEETPAELVNLKPGRYTLLVKHPTLGSKTQSVTLRPGIKKRVVIGIVR